jgi:Swiss Army Knife RNA repair-like protein
MTVPLLFLDVDGTLLPVGGAQTPTTDEGWTEWQTRGNPLLARITRSHGPRLRALQCELMWATAWMHDANEVIAPMLGLPVLPVVELGELPGADEPAPPPESLGWKTQALVGIAAGRPFVWIDDEITEADRDWIAARHDGPALAYRVDSRHGLTDADLVSIEDWLRGL